MTGRSLCAPWKCVCWQERPLTELHQAGRQGLQGYAALKIGLNPPRQALYERIEKRVHLCLIMAGARKWRRCIADGAPPTAKPFEFIGYRELRAHLETRAAASRIRLRPSRKRRVATPNASSPGFGGNRASSGSRVSGTNRRRSRHALDYLEPLLKQFHKCAAGNRACATRYN